MNLISAILAKRGISNQDQKSFLNPDYYNPTNYGDFPGMEAAVDVVRQAVGRGAKICVYGDYDVDGVTATALLVSVLNILGAHVTYKVPNRFKEGYGLNAGVIQGLADDGVNLILTCDCGISNYHEVALANELGIEVVITDHHHLPEELPPARAIVNPQMLPEGHGARHIPGVAVAYYLARGLMARYGREEDCRQFLDLVALGVVADVVPLTGENRYLLQRGLPLISQPYRPGIKALLDIAQLDPRHLTEEDIGFQLAPRINAAGRMEDARYGVELMLSENLDSACRWAVILDEINKRRRQVGEQMLAEAEALLNPGEVKPIVMFQPHWHQGIVGITAGRLCEKYRVPVILMTQREDGRVVGSARSVEGVHMVDAIGQCSEFLLGYGGHAGAAGLSLHRDQLAAFIKVCQRVLEERMTGVEHTTEIYYDLELPLGEVNKKLFHQLRELAPFGEGWPQPLFYCPGVDILSARPTTGEKHLRLVLHHNGCRMPAIHWWAGDTEPGERSSLLYNISLNRWQGEENVQLVVNSLWEAVTPVVTEPIRGIENILDFRQWREKGEVIPRFAGSICYHEGYPLKDFSFQTYDRYGVTSADALVLLICPPSPGILREIVALSGCKELVLAYSFNRPLGISECIKMTMSYIKHAINHRDGRLTVCQLAAFTGQTELLIMGIIKFLRQSGLLVVEVMPKGELLVGMGSEKSQGVNPPAVLRKLLEEANAYRRHMVSAPVGVIKNNFNI